MARMSITEMPLAKVYPLLVSKAEKKGRTRQEVDTLTAWLLGWTEQEIENLLHSDISYGDFFTKGTYNPKGEKVTGTVCGVRVEQIEDDTMRHIRQLDKMVDELAKGKAVEKILRSGDEPANVDEYIAAFPTEQREKLMQVRKAIRDVLPNADEVISYGMPTYRQKQNLIHFAAMKKHIGIYPGDKAAAFFAEKLQPYSVSKGTIRIPWNRELPLDLIQEIALWCKENS